MYNIDILNIFTPLFEHLYNFFAILGEIANTTSGDFLIKLPLGELTYSILNPFTTNEILFTLDLGFIGNNLLTGIVNTLTNIAQTIYNLDLLSQPFYVTILLISIPLIFVFFFVRLFGNIFN